MRPTVHFGECQFEALVTQSEQPMMFYQLPKQPDSHYAQSFPNQPIGQCSCRVSIL